MTRQVRPVLRVVQTDRERRLDRLRQTITRVLASKTIWRCWSALKILLYLWCLVVGIAVVLLSIAVLLVSLMRVLLPRT